MIRSAVIVLLAFFAGPASAEAWTSLGAKWPLSQLPLAYTVGPGCGDFPDEESVALAQRVFERWEDAPCAHVSFEYVGRGADYDLADGGRGFLGDGFNNVSFCTSCLVEAIGVAIIDVAETGVLRECDEEVEDGFTFTLDHDLAAEGGLFIDAEAVVAQESGHCLGLGHTDVDRATMSEFYVAGWEMWTPDADDVEGLCSIYPMEEGCTAHEQCKDGTSCVEGVCVPLMRPPRGFGDPCADASECLSGICVMDPGTGESRCTVACDLDEPACPGGEVCVWFGPCEEAFCVTEEGTIPKEGTWCGDDAGTVEDAGPEGPVAARGGGIGCRAGASPSPRGTTLVVASAIAFGRIGNRKATGNRQQATGNRQQAMSRRATLFISCCLLPVACLLLLLF